MLISPISIMLIIESRWTYPTCASQWVSAHMERTGIWVKYVCFSWNVMAGGMQGGWVAQRYYFFAKKRRSPFPRVVEGFRFLNLVMILIRYLNTCKKRLGQNLMVCKKAPAIFSSRLQFAKTLFCMVGGWLVCFKAIAFFCRT